MDIKYHPPKVNSSSDIYVLKNRVDETVDWCEQNFITFDERFAKLDDILAQYKENAKKQEARIKKLEKQIKELNVINTQEIT